MLKVKEDGLNIIFMLIQNFKELVFEFFMMNQSYYYRQSGLVRSVLQDYIGSNLDRSICLDWTENHLRVIQDANRCSGNFTM